MEESDQGTEIERLRAEVAALKQKLDEKERTEASLRAELFDIRSLVDQLPVGVFAVDLQGKVLFANPGARHFTAGHDPGTNLEEWPQKLGLFSSDKVTHYPAAELPLSRALLGDIVRDVDVFVRNEASPDGFWLESHAAPLLDAKGEPRGAVTVFVDAESRRSLETEVATRTKELVANESEKSELIARLRMAVQELSTPILELWEDVLALPVIGVVDSRRSAEMMERLLDEIVRSQSRFVIIDLTGVEVIDTSTADHFMKLVKAVGLIGARCVLTGIRPAVAQTLVDLDVNFGQLETLRNLKHGLRHCLRWLDAEGTAHTR